jgi:branched-chain amino acid transport system substrate-binding protein
VKLPAPLTTLGIGAAGVLLSLAFASILACSQPVPTVSEVNSSTPASASQETRPTPSISESLAQAGQTNGVFDDRILFGQSAAFSGPARELGTNMRLGIQTAFHEVNENGGVHGRVLELISFDDAYEPEAAVNNTLRLIEQEEVFALIGEVGTPTSRSATPIAADAGIPFIAPFTGAEFLRNDDWQNIINLRASYYQETEEMVARLIDDLGITRIGVLFQDDSYGRAGYRGVLFALDRRDLKPASIGLYPRNTTAIKAALLDLSQGNPEAVIMIGAYDPVAELVSWARHTGVDPIFMTVSFVGSNALARELGSDGEGVYVTQVVPFPTDDSQRIVSSYINALSAYDPEAVPGFVSFEGYLAGRLAIEGLRRCGQEVDRTCFLEILNYTDYIDIDGFTLRYGSDNQGSNEVFLTVIGDDGKYKPVEQLGRDN